LEEAPKIDLPILLEKPDYIVIYKPKWVLSHPNSVWDIKSPSVVGFLYHKYKNLPSIGNFIRAWLIHRLDKETDWLMIVVKTERWLKYFKDLFQRKSQLVEKFLSSWNYNIENFKQLENNIPLKKFYKASVNITDKGRLFINSIRQFPYYIIEEVKPKVPHYTSKIGITKILSIDWDNVDIEILTWRTHQIRYHLAQKWLPIKGDYLYWEADNCPLKLKAYRLVFKDPDWVLQDIKVDNVGQFD
jgi:23S rRNA pseudouridine1911/1915/1917 synthase